MSKVLVEKNIKNAVKAYEIGNTTVARRLLKKVIQIEPNNCDANHIMGLALIKDNKIDASLNFFKAALEANFGVALYWLNYINALFLSGKIQESLDLFQVAKSKGCRGKSFDDLERKITSPEVGLQLKVQRHKELIEGQPNSGFAYLGLAEALREQGNFDEALRAYRKALYINPNSLDAYLNVGIILTGQGKLEEAIEAYEKAISIKPSCAEAYNNMGVVFHRQGKLDLAIESLNNALLLKLDYAEAYINLGNVLNDQNKLDEAIRAYDNAIGLSDHQYQAKHNLGELLKTYSPNNVDGNQILVLDKNIKAASSEINFLENDYDLSLSLKKLLKKVQNIEPELRTNSLQIYKRNSFDLNCKRHTKVFEVSKIISNSCFKCFKIQVEVKSLLDLIRLSSLFYAMDFKDDLTTKCLIEVRHNIPGSYKGLIYCDGINQAQDVQKQLNVHLKIIEPHLTGKIKRGCSEFPLIFPKYGDIDGSESDWMKYPSKWQIVEDEFDQNYSDKVKSFVTPSLREFCLNDCLIIQKWIDYAKGCNDPTAELFGDIEIKYHDMFNIGRSRQNV